MIFACQVPHYDKFERAREPHGLLSCKNPLFAQEKGPPNEAAL